MPEGVAFESTLERDFLVRLEADQRVLTVTSQPLTIKFAGFDGRAYPYTPDYLVRYRPVTHVSENKIPPALIEVKPNAELREHLIEWKPKFRTAIRFCKEQGFIFHFMDETRIRDQRWKNVVFLQRYRKMQVEDIEIDRIADHLRMLGMSSISDLLANHFRTHPVDIRHLWHLVATSKISCDLSLPLSNSTVLWVPNNEC